MRLHGAALERLQAWRRRGMRRRLFSLTDEYPYAYAQVIISAEPLAYGLTLSPLPWNETGY